MPGPPPHQILEDPANPMAFWLWEKSMARGFHEKVGRYGSKKHNFSVEWVWHQDFRCHDIKNAEALYFQISSPSLTDKEVFWHDTLRSLPLKMFVVSFCGSEIISCSQGPLLAPVARLRHGRAAGHQWQVPHVQPIFPTTGLARIQSLQSAVFGQQEKYIPSGNQTWQWKIHYL